MDTVGPRFVVRGRDDAAAVRVAAHDEGTGRQLRLLELLDCGEERVQIQVSDDHMRAGNNTNRAGPLKD